MDIIYTEKNPLIFSDKALLYLLIIERKGGETAHSQNSIEKSQALR